MSPKSFLLSEPIHDYLLAHLAPLDAVQQELIAETEELGAVAGMQIAPEQAAFMAVLASLIGARRAIEVGTFTGYSALAVARAMGPGSHLLCCDVSEEWTSIGRKYWEQAGVADRIELRLGPAVDTLRSLPPDAAFDLAFIDADKASYLAYYEEIVPRLRPNGLLLVDNTLWSGRVIGDVGDDDVDTLAIRAFNDHVTADPRMESVLLPVADGITFCRRR